MAGRAARGGHRGGAPQAPDRGGPQVRRWRRHRTWAGSVRNWPLRPFRPNACRRAGPSATDGARWRVSLEFEARRKRGQVLELGAARARSIRSRRQSLFGCCPGGLQVEPGSSSAGQCVDVDLHRTVGGVRAVAVVSQVCRTVPRRGGEGPGFGGESPPRLRTTRMGRGWCGVAGADASRWWYRFWSRQPPTVRCHLPVLLARDSAIANRGSSGVIPAAAACCSVMTLVGVSPGRFAQGSWHIRGQPGPAMRGFPWVLLRGWGPEKGGRPGWCCCASSAMRRGAFRPTCPSVLGVPMVRTRPAD